MLPEVVGAKKAIGCIVSTSILLVLFSLLLYLLGSFGLLYLIIASVLGVPLLLLNLWLIIHPSKKNAWGVSKFSSTYLAIVFLGMIADVLLS